MHIEQRQSWVGLLNVVLSLVLVVGGCLTLLVVTLFFYAVLFRHYIPHPYELPISVTIPDEIISVASARNSAQYLVLARWKVNLLAVESKSPGFFTLQLSWILLQPGITLVIVWMIRRIVVAVRAGEPFQKEAFKRLRVIGWLVIIAAAGRTLEDYLAGFFAMHQYTLSHGRIELSFDFMALFWGVAVGLMILVLAEVFRYGYSIQQETELTV